MSLILSVLKPMFICKVKTMDIWSIEKGKIKRTSPARVQVLLIRFGLSNPTLVTRVHWVHTYTRRTVSLLKSDHPELLIDLINKLIGISLPIRILLNQIIDRCAGPPA